MAAPGAEVRRAGVQVAQAAANRIAENPDLQVGIINAIAAVALYFLPSSIVMATCAMGVSVKIIQADTFKLLKNDWTQFGSRSLSIYFAGHAIYSGFASSFSPMPELCIVAALVHMAVSVYCFHFANEQEKKEQEQKQNAPQGIAPPAPNGARNNVPKPLDRMHQIKVSTHLIATAVLLLVPSSIVLGITASIVAIKILLPDSMEVPNNRWTLAGLRVGGLYFAIRGVIDAASYSFSNTPEYCVVASTIYLLISHKFFEYTYKKEEELKAKQEPIDLSPQDYNQGKEALAQLSRRISAHPFVQWLASHVS